MPKIGKIPMDCSWWKNMQSIDRDRFSPLKAFAFSDNRTVNISRDTNIRCLSNFIPVFFFFYYDEPRGQAPIHKIHKIHKIVAIEKMKRNPDYSNRKCLDVEYDVVFEQPCRLKLLVKRTFIRAF